jgi:hypothetical protein
MFGIDAQTEVQLDGLIELDELDLLEERDRVGQIVRAGFYLFRSGFKLLTWFSHLSSLVQTAGCTPTASLPPTEFDF